MGANSLEQQGAVLLAQSDGCAVWQFRNETGDGTMTAYQVLPGVLLSFNDFHMERFESSYVADRRMLAIDHCREGRMEYTPGANMLAYTAAGDMKLDLRQRHTGTFVFPSHHYHGLTIAFDLDAVRHSLPQACRDFPVTPEQLIDRWSLGAYPRVVHDAAELSPIFEALYQVPEQIRIPYFKVKILELLLRLHVMPIPESDSPPPYFYKTQVETVKAIRDYLTAHLSQHIAQEELSRRFHIPMTPMKTCFRAVYGEAIGTWITRYRMNYAAELLRTDHSLSIAEIGGRIGYDNPGKFTEAFKRIMKATPSEYRKERGIGYET